jgi:NAD(P)-dependent dehydrogenase (short-subunit alcohol dehydrogenase family)
MMTATPQVALVTGATSGIGKATAIALAAAGFQVIGTGRNTARLTAPAGVTYLDLDVTSDESVASAVTQVIDRFGRIDVLVNNAGVGSTGAAEEFSITQTQDIFDINVYGVMRTTKAVLPQMRAQGRGRIINVSSLSGFVPSPFMALYVSTKHAVEGYSQSLDHEVRDHGIRVLLVEPGPINTPFAGHSVQADTPMPLYAAGRRTAGNHRPDHQRGVPRRPGPQLRPRHPQIQPDAELIAPLGYVRDINNYGETNHEVRRQNRTGNRRTRHDHDCPH